MKRYSLPLCGISLLLLTSCSSKKDEPTPIPENYKRTILVYAVASNNLESNLVANKKQMIEGMEDVDLSQYNLMVYEVNNKDSHIAKLQKLVKGADSKLRFETVKEFGRFTFSTDPKRVNEVINTVASEYKSDKIDLFFWSHGSAWEYATPIHKALGWDNYQGQRDYLNINELAEAIPQGLVDMIWFDNCYMANIETIFELHGKCKNIVAYPTEIWSTGTPYENILPYLMTDNRDLAKAASEIGKYYGERAYTVAVINVDAVNDVASAALPILVNKQNMPAEKSLLKYSRKNTVEEPLYDFSDYIHKIVEMNPEIWSVTVSGKLLSAFDASMNQLVEYKDCSDVDFNGNSLNRSIFSGINCHYFTDEEDEQNNFYKKLKWYKSIYTPNR